MAADIEFKGAKQMIREFARNGELTKRFEKRMTYAINQSAFSAREATRGYLTSVIDNPTPFTLRPPYVHKAKTTDMKATLQSLDKQDAYLSNLESGGVKRDARIPVPGSADKYGNLRKRFTQSGIAGLLDEKIQVQRSAGQVKKRKEEAKAAKKAQGTRKRDKNGRFLKSSEHKITQVSVPKLSEIKAELGTREVGQYFVGEVRGRKGLWKRLSQNRGLQLIYAYKSAQRYEKRIALKDFWTREAERVMDEEFSKDWLSGQ